MKYWHVLKPQIYFLNYSSIQIIINITIIIIIIIIIIIRITIIIINYYRLLIYFNDS